MTIRKAVALWAGLAPALALAVTPSDGGPISLSPVVINAGPGNQTDPHVSGDLAAYTTNESGALAIHYYRFSSGVDRAVPSVEGAVDQLSDVSGTRVVFSRAEPSGRVPVLVYDVASDTLTEVAPEPEPYRLGAAIGGSVVAYVDLAASSNGELFVADLGDGATRLTSDARIDRRPNVSPLGDHVVWESCATGTSCDVLRASRAGATWVVGALAASADSEGNPDTDGVIAVYDVLRAGDRDIAWQPIAGGAESTLALPGEQRNPSVSAGVVAFESISAGETMADLFVYATATNQLYRVTTTAALDERLNDVTVLPDGRVRVVWARADATGASDVHGATFELPRGGGGGTCTPRRVELQASRTYHPTGWSDGHADLSPAAALVVPASLDVAEGNAGNFMARLTFTRAGLEPLTCFYKGATAPHPESPAEVEAGLRYVFHHCTDDTVGAGSTVRADAVDLHVQGADSRRPRTTVRLALDEQCPEAAADAAGCSSSGGGFWALALGAALLLLLAPRRPAETARVRVRARRR